MARLGQLSELEGLLLLLASNAGSFMSGAVSGWGTTGQQSVSEKEWAAQT